MKNRFELRLFAFIISLILLVNVSTIVINASADSIDIVADETRALKLLIAANIINGFDDGSLKPEKEVTRAEMAEILIKLIGINQGTAADNSKIEFSDVKPDNVHYTAIATINDLGIINGYSDNTFRPDTGVTFEQTIKMLIVALGYGFLAENKGGYPSGYISVAQDNKILKNVHTQNGQTMTRGAIARLIFNSLEVNTAEMTGFNFVHTFINKGKMVMENLDIYKVEGIINDNGITNLTGASVLPDNRIKINDLILYNSDNSNRKLLGYNVTCYYQKMINDSMGKILYIEPNMNKNQVWTINSDMIDYNNEKFSRTNVIYNDVSGKNDSVSVSEYAYIIYNGMADMQNLSVDIYKQGDSKYTLIDNDGDDKADIVKIDKYVDYIVDSVSVEGKLIGKYTDPLDLNPDNNKIKPYITDLEGIEKTITDAKEWDVVSIKFNKQGTPMEVVISSNAVDGSISEIGSESDGSKVVIIDGKQYKLSSSLPQSVADNMTLNYTGTFYLNIDNKIAAINKNIDNSNNQYAISFSVGKKSGLDSKPQIKLFTTKGEFEVFDLYDRIDVEYVSQGVLSTKNIKSQDILLSQSDITRYQSSDLSGFYKSFYYNNNNTIQIEKQLIRYTTNDKGQISKISVAASADYRSTDYFSKWYDLDDVYYSIGAGVDGLFNPSGNTIIFRIGYYDAVKPPVGKAANKASDNEDDYYVKNKTLLSASGNYKIKIYDCDENYVPKVMILMNNATDPDANVNNVMIPDANDDFLISEPVKSAIVNDEIVVKLTGYINGKSSEAYSSDKTLKSVPVAYLKTLSGAQGYSGIKITDLKPGDVIQFESNSKNEIKAFRLLSRAIEGFDNNNQTLYETAASTDLNLSSSRHYNFPLYMACGSIMKISSNNLVISTSADKKDLKSFTLLQGVKYFYKYTSNGVNSKLITTDTFDISKGDRVIVFDKGEALKEVIVIK